MRFRKGSKVEVLCNKHVPSGSWRCAEIICGSGHIYTVRYAGHTGTTGEILVERISRKAIRPCPPLPEIAENWVPGDVVELFDKFSWKMATISKVLCEEYFLVRILGSSLEFKVSKFDIRTRQCWQDNKWIVIGKGSANENSTLKYKRKPWNNVQSTKTRLNEHVRYNFFPFRYNEILQESNIVSCKTSKGGPYDCKQAEAYDGAAQKYRAVENEGMLHRMIVANQSLLAERVDYIACPRETVGEIFMHFSLNSQNRFSEMDMERRQQSGAVGCSSAVELDSDDEVSATSSVGSCSIASNNYYMLHHRSGFDEDIDGHCSDAESFCQGGHEEGNILLPTKEELAVEIRRLELHAYRCTMEALYASGPLSWDQEVLVTNLRLSLQISNDEHLMEVRNLVSADNSIPSR